MTRVIIPQIIEELLPARTRANLPVEQVRAPLADYDHETWDQSFRTTVRSLTVTEEPSPQPLLKPGAVTAAAVPVVETVPEDASAVPPPTAAEPREVPEIIRALDTGAGEPVTTETAPATGPVPEPSSASEEAGIREIAEPQVTEPVPENEVQESVDLPASEEASGMKSPQQLKCPRSGTRLPRHADPPAQNNLRIHCHPDPARRTGSRCCAAPPPGFGKHRQHGNTLGNHAGYHGSPCNNAACYRTFCYHPDHNTRPVPPGISCPSDGRLGTGEFHGILFRHCRQPGTDAACFRARGTISIKSSGATAPCRCQSRNRIIPVPCLRSQSTGTVP